jgi:hypothetical protein
VIAVIQNGIKEFKNNMLCMANLASKTSTTPSLELAVTIAP